MILTDWVLSAPASFVGLDWTSIRRYWPHADWIFSNESAEGGLCDLLLAFSFTGA